MDFDIRKFCRGKRVMVLSPHLDDGVFGCGELLSSLDEAVVTTAFAGMPPSATGLTDWDAACGFRNSQEAVRLRWHEDDEALQSLGAEPVRLGFLDSQYGAAVQPAQLAAALQEVMAARRADVVLLPMGLFHSDHALVHEAALACMPHVRAETWVAYEDALYRRQPGLLQKRLRDLLGRGLEATPLCLNERALDRKREAVRAYRSQLRAFGPGGYADTEAPESYWLLRTPKDDDVDEA